MAPGMSQLVVALSVLLVGWLFAGRELNRRRGNALARAIRAALPALGASATIQPVGSGLSAFRVEVQQPVRGVAAAEVLCILEARDFPLAWAWTRLRGRRDQIILRLQCDAAPPPLRLDARSPGAAALGLRRLVLAAAQPDPPHVQVSFGVGAGEEDEIGKAFALAVRLARGEVRAAG